MNVTANSNTARLLSGRLYFARRGAQVLLESVNFSSRPASARYLDNQIFHIETDFRLPDRIVICRMKMQQTGHKILSHNR